MENSNELMLVFDEKGSIKIANEKAQRTLGFTLFDTQTQNVLNFLPSIDEDNFQRLLNSTEIENKTTEFTTEVQTIETIEKGALDLVRGTENYYLFIYLDFRANISSKPESLTENLKKGIREFTAFPSFFFSFSGKTH